jgi:hypothetical protein
MSKEPLSDKAQRVRDAADAMAEYNYGKKAELEKTRAERRFDCRKKRPIKQLAVKPKKSPARRWIQSARAGV